MKYISTRGQAPALSFEDVVLTGLAPDGGLFVPQTLPQFSGEEIASWAGLPYNELALKVISPFVDGAIPAADLKGIIDASYSDFRHRTMSGYLNSFMARPWPLKILPCSFSVICSTIFSISVAKK